MNEQELEEFFIDNKGLAIAALKKYFGSIPKIEHRANKYGCTYHDYVQIAFEALWKCCKKFNPQYKLSLYVYPAVLHSILAFEKWHGNILKMPGNKSVDVDFMAIDAPVENNSFHDIIPDRANFEHTVIKRVTLMQMLKTLNDYERFIIVERLRGRKLRELSEMLGYSDPSIISKQSKAIIRKLRETEMNSA